MKGMINGKILWVIIVLFVLSFFTFNYFYSKSQEKKEIRETLEKLTEAVNLMESIKAEMPEELLNVHEFLVQLNQEGKFKLYQIHPELKGKQIMYHGVKSKGIFVDPSVNLRAEIWIPIFYHEAGHLYWHSKYPVETFEEFQKQLPASEEHSYIVEAQAWNIVKEHFPVKEGFNQQGLKLFNIYQRETSLYNKMIEGDVEAETKWKKIIEENIKVQEQQQEFLKKSFQSNFQRSNSSFQGIYFGFIRVKCPLNVKFGGF